MNTDSDQPSNEEILKQHLENQSNDVIFPNQQQSNDVHDLDKQTMEALNVLLNALQERSTHTKSLLDPQLVQSRDKSILSSINNLLHPKYNPYDPHRYEHNFIEKIELFLNSLLSIDNNNHIHSELLFPEHSQAEHPQAEPTPPKPTPHEPISTPAPSKPTPTPSKPTPSKPSHHKPSHHKKRRDIETKTSNDTNSQSKSEYPIINLHRHNK